MMNMRSGWVLAVLWVTFLGFARSGYSAEQCMLTVPSDINPELSDRLSERGYSVTHRMNADYELIFDEFVSQPIYDIGGHRPVDSSDRLIAVKGSIVMKIVKLMPNGRRHIEFQMSHSGSVAVDRDLSHSREAFRLARARLYGDLSYSQIFVDRVASCREID